MDEDSFPEINFKVFKTIISKWVSMYPCIERILLYAQPQPCYKYYIVILNDMNSPENQLMDFTQKDMAGLVDEEFHTDLSMNDFMGNDYFKQEWSFNIQFRIKKTLPQKLKLCPHRKIILFEREKLSLACGYTQPSGKNENPDDKKLMPPSEDIEQELKNITIRYENDTHITIQQKSKPQISVDLTDLRFQLKKKTKTITWDNFLKVLQHPPTSLLEMP